MTPAETLLAALLAMYPDAAGPKLQNWNLAPFKYINSEGSRFFDPTGPALELTDDRQTALAVSVARRQVFLARTQEPPIGLDMRMLKTPVTGRFVDLRDQSLDLSRDLRWQIGASVPDDADGILYRPPERPSATCIAVLRDDALGQTIQTMHYRFVWNATRISKLYAFDSEGRKLLPEDLSAEGDALAA